MRKLFILVLVIGIVGLSSCGSPKPNNQGKLVIKFNPMMGSNTITLKQVYPCLDGNNYNFQDFKFFLSHIKLMYTNGDSVEVEPMAYFSLDDPACMSISISAPAGSYKGIRFNIGLDPTQDAMPQNMADTTNPLSYSHYMTWGDTAKKFVFTYVDGYADNTSSPQASFEYHVGTTPYYTTAPVLAKNFSVTGGTQTLVLNAQMQNIFYGSSSSINVATQNYTETGSSNDPLAFQFINDFSQTFSLQ